MLSGARPAAFSFPNLHRLAAAAFVVVNQPFLREPTYRARLRKWDQEAGTALLAIAAAPPAGSTDEIIGSADDDPAELRDVDISAVPAINARLLLRREIRHALASRA
jgi:hypothetical protein